MAATAVTLNDLECHSLLADVFKCNLSNICAAFYAISTDSVLARFLCISRAFCCARCTLVRLQVANNDCVCPTTKNFARLLKYKNIKPFKTTRLSHRHAKYLMNTKQYSRLRKCLHHHFPISNQSVSYTHLTLPTIYSV